MSKAAKENADRISNDSPRGTGRLGKSLGYFSTKYSRAINGLYFGPRVRGKFAKKSDTYKGTNKNKMYLKSGFYGAWIEYGGEVKFGGKAPAEKGNQPYLEPAFESTKAQMNASAREMALSTVERIRKTVKRRTDKYGYLGRGF
mgnify:CR=1 FL=1